MRNTALYLASLFIYILFAHQASIAATGASVPLLDINAATAAQLAKALPGIGPAKAARIVQWREQHGVFTHVEQLQEVKGIGAKTVEKLRPLVRIGTAADARLMQLEQKGREQKTRSDIRRVIDTSRIVTTAGSADSAPEKPWFQRSALQLLRSH